MPLHVGPVVAGIVVLPLGPSLELALLMVGVGADKVEAAPRLTAVAHGDRDVGAALRFSLGF